MILKTSTAALCSCSRCPPVFVLLSSPVSITSSCDTGRQTPLGRRQYSASRKGLASISRSCPTGPQSRAYASTSDRPSKQSHSPEHGWPSSPHPTPYEIFDQQRGAPYSKGRFYELVKIYHPDRHHVSPDTMANHVRLERYRLVVVANEILSDPIKRRAYDLYGAGWGGKLAMENNYRAADKAWRERPGSPSMNATWEDWEEWHRQQNGEKKKQETVYMSNEMFVFVLCAFVLVGSMTQAKRASTHSMNIVDMRDQKHGAISQDIQKRQGELAPLDRHERVENFLRQRESWRLASSMGDYQSNVPDQSRNHDHGNK